MVKEKEKKKKKKPGRVLPRRPVARAIPVVPPPPPPSRQLVAAIEIGASAIRMDIAEVQPDGSVRTLENLRQTVRLGKDIFAMRRIHQETIRECVEVLKRFVRLLMEYGFPRGVQVRAVSTSFVREASNRDTFMDRLCTATGLDVTVLDESEEIRLTYLALQDVLGESRLQAVDDVLVLVLGSGQTIGLLIQQGQVTLAQSFRVGALRTHELLIADGGTGDRLRNLLRAHGDELVEQLMQVLPLEQVSMLVVMGSGARFTAEEAGISKTKNETPVNPWVTEVSPAKILELADELAPIPVERLVRNLRMAFQDAETVAPALMSIAQVLRATQAGEVLVVNTHIRDGLLKEMSMHERDSASILFEEQVVYAAHTLAARYEADDVHAKNVAAICMMLFDELKEEHALGRHERIMLRCAAILHDIGTFVNPRGHHKHSMYLIQNSSIFGLSGEDMPLVALTARYHRKAAPSASHPEFIRLGRRERTLVIKMAALLRVADALECTHQTLLRRMEFQREGDRLVILVRNTEDLTMERLALREKGDLFSEVFGITIDLREARAEELSFGRA